MTDRLPAGGQFVMKQASEWLARKSMTIATDRTRYKWAWAIFKLGGLFKDIEK